MSFESDFISKDLQLSPASISEKYTDEAHSMKLSVPEGACCHCHIENGQEYIRLSETDSTNLQERQTPDHQHFEYNEHNNHDFIYPEHYQYECVCPQHSQHRYRRIPHWSTITMSDEDVEVLSDSDYYRQFDDVFYIEPSVARSLLSKFLVQEKTPSQIHVDTRTKQQRFIARTVMIISIVMFTVSVFLVIISLIMSGHIDKLVRNTDTVLTKTPVSTTTISSPALIWVNGTINNRTNFG